MTDDFAWAAGHGKWQVPPQAEGFCAGKEGGKAPPLALTLRQRSARAE